MQNIYDAVKLLKIGGKLIITELLRMSTLKCIEYINIHYSFLKKMTIDCDTIIIYTKITNS